MKAQVIAWWLVGLGLLTPGMASAYCRTTTCDQTTTACATDPDDRQCVVDGVPLQWPIGCVGVSLNEKASVQVSYADFLRVATAAFDAWNKVSCEGQTPSISTTILGPVVCDEQQFNDEKGNANIVLFRDDDWPYTGQSSVLALTTLTFGVKTGIIYDADMEIRAKPGDVRLTTSDEDVDTDLQSIITHEAGHFLGLAHTSVAEATMLPYYPPKSTKFRSLEADDAAGLCAAYPHDRAGVPACDPGGPSPRSLGLSSQCGGADVVAKDSDSGCGCRAVASGPTPGAGLGGVLGALGMGGLLRRRRRASR